MDDGNRIATAADIDNDEPVVEDLSQQGQAMNERIDALMAPHISHSDAFMDAYFERLKGELHSWFKL